MGGGVEHALQGREDWTCIKGYGGEDTSMITRR